MTPRFHVADPLAEGQSLTLPPQDSHHLCVVLRRTVGDPLLVFNGREGEFLASVSAASGKAAQVILGRRLRIAEPEIDLSLLFAPLKKEATDFIVEKATELGVSRLLPISARRGVAENFNLDRARRNAVLAAQQCGRLSVPAIEAPVPLDRLLAEWPDHAPILACAERGPARPIAEVLAELTRHVTPPNRWAILCGPEGGFDEVELDRLTELPFVSLVGLGPRILRAETAAIAALALFQSIVGDGALRPARRV